MKEQDRVTARELSRTDTSNMTDGESKATIIRILASLRKEWKTRETLITEIKE